jgi:hypothetical protein
MPACGPITLTLEPGQVATGDVDATVKMRLNGGMRRYTSRGCVRTRDWKVLKKEQTRFFDTTRLRAWW